MENIKIVRLKNGEDVVGHMINVTDESCDIIDPMSVGVEFHGKQAGLVMRHWLPIQLVKKNEITLKHNDILCVLEPDDEFVEYYTNTVKKLNELLKAKNLVNSLDDEEVDNIMSAIEELNHHGNILH